MTREYYHKEYRSIIEHYPVDTCPLCLSNTVDTVVSVNSANTTQHGIDIAVPICNSCNAAPQEDLYIVLSLLGHYSYNSTLSAKIQQITGDLTAKNTTFITAEDDKPVKQYIYDNKDQVDVILEETITNTEFAFIVNEDTEQALIINLDEGIKFILEGYNVYMRSNTDLCCVRHLDKNNIESLLKYSNTTETPFNINHIQKELSDSLVARNI